MADRGRHQLVHREPSRGNDERIRFLSVRKEQIGVHNRNIFVFVPYGNTRVLDRVSYDGCVPEDLRDCLLEPARPLHGDHGWRKRFKRFQSRGVFPFPRVWAFGSCILRLVRSGMLMSSIPVHSRCLRMLLEMVLRVIYPKSIPSRIHPTERQFCLLQVE